MNAALEHLKSIYEAGGPSREEYPALMNSIQQVAHMKRNMPSQEYRPLIASVMGSSFSKDTMQGFSFAKPYGYSGDFEIIERIYHRYISTEPHLARWDVFFQSSEAAQAVRNRKEYFKRCMEHLNLTPRSRVLNIASGPASDLFEYVLDTSSMAHFDCIDADENAIQYASRKFAPIECNVHFTHKNLFKFNPGETTYDAIWSAGLFDYFNDDVFVSVLNKLHPWLHEGSTLVVGNFSENNPAEHYMSVFDWELTYRSRERLIELAKMSLFRHCKIQVDSEPHGINLFLRITV